MSHPRAAALLLPSLFLLLVSLAACGRESTAPVESPSIAGHWSGPFTVDGTLRGQDVELGLTSTEFGATTYTGRFVARDRITGHLQAAAYSDLALTLERD